MRARTESEQLQWGGGRDYDQEAEDADAREQWEDDRVDAYLEDEILSKQDESDE